MTAPGSNQIVDWHHFALAALCRAQGESRRAWRMSIGRSCDLPVDRRQWQVRQLSRHEARAAGPRCPSTDQAGPFASTDLDGPTPSRLIEVEVEVVEARVAAVRTFSHLVGRCVR